MMVFATLLGVLTLPPLLVAKRLATVAEEVTAKTQEGFFTAALAAAVACMEGVLPQQTAAASLTVAAQALQKHKCETLPQTAVWGF